jgi:Zn-dependent protease
MFIEVAQSNPFYFFSWIIIITFSICVHEYAHAQVALWKGDDTAARYGHLSLNPLVQMGWTSLLMLVLIGIAWGAVPVDVSRMRGKSAAAQVAFAGPAANLILCVLFGIIGAVTFVAGASNEVMSFIAMASKANAVLFLFNMIPIPMFDGWTVMSLFVEPMRRVDVQRISGYSWMALVVIWTTGVMEYIWEIGDKMGFAVMIYTATALRAVIPGM